MKLKTELLNAMKLFLLLRLLFWSFTWNIPPGLDLSSEKPRSLSNEEELKDMKNDFFFKDEKKDLRDSCDSFAYESRKSDVCSDILIPSFKDWRKKELEEYEKNHAKYSVIHQHKKFVHRKLNYASSKCGAKILSSNPESRNRMAVLSEKSEEYFLNPCRVTTWFVIELCDAVEVTEVELANYELYSSSPKEFSVFWSEIFPTFLWQHLGTFVAEDKRTIQTFNVRVKNMGKFIKVVIHSRHGREHYCPLSVIRVLGYSMVQTFEDIEDNQNIVTSDFVDEGLVNSVKTFPAEKENVFQELTKTEFVSLSTITSYGKHFCDQLFNYCSNISSNYSIKNACVKKLTCRFLLEIMNVANANCLDIFCPKYPALFLKVFNSTSMIKLKNNHFSQILLQPEKLRQNVYSDYETKDIIKDYEHKKSLRLKKEKYIYDSDKVKEISRKSIENVEDYCASGTGERIKNYPDVLDPVPFRSMYGKITRMSENMCICEKYKGNVDSFSETHEVMTPQQKDYGHEIDSATLINKESVLYKLAAKIKTSEVDLTLINKYLQKLSQSYPQHVKEMKIKLNNASREINKASEEATILNKKQDEYIVDLKTKIETLNAKIDTLMTGKNNLIKRVFELHGFILIIEIIVIATVFNVLMNIFHKKNVFKPK